MKYWMIACLSLCFISQVLWSQGSSASASYLNFPTIPFSASTGEAFVADLQHPQSLLLNPANIADIHSFGLLFSHSIWMQDIRTEYLSTIAPLSFGTLGMSITTSSVDGIEVRTIPGPPIETFNSKSTIFQLSYATILMKNLSVGASAKYIYDKIYIDETTGYGLDFGLVYSPGWEGVDLGVSLTNLGKLSAFRSESNSLPSLLRLGGTYSFNQAAFDFRFAAQYAFGLNTSFKSMNLGSEVLYNKQIALSCGYQTGYAYKSITFGLGLVYEFLTVEYASIPFSDQMGYGHIISLFFNF